MKTYNVISESDGIKETILSTTRKRDAERLFRSLFRSHKKSEKDGRETSLCILKNEGWFEHTYFIGGYEFVYNYYIAIN